MSELIVKGKKSKEVSFILGNLSTGEKNKGLEKMADFLVNNKDEIIKANKIDLKIAIEKGTSKSMLDRLTLNEDRIEGMANGLIQVANLPDPVGEVLQQQEADAVSQNLLRPLPVPFPQPDSC